MTYVIVNPTSKRIVTTARGFYGTQTFTSIGAAKTSLTAYVKRNKSGWSQKALDEALSLVVMTLDDYNATVRTTKMVRNLMSGKMVEIDVNTPNCCDPSSETYWSM